MDLAIPDLAPEGWPEEASPPQGPFTDISVYELHIRDFSASDSTVPDDLRGKYLAFGLVGNLFQLRHDSRKSAVPLSPLASCDKAACWQMSGLPA